MLEKLENLVSELGEAERQERIELLIDLARDLPPLPERLGSFKDEAHRVPECMSPVFLFAERADDGTFVLHADVPPEAPTVRGFVSMLVLGLTGSPLEHVASLNNDLLERCGLREILGMQRVSGLYGVVRRLKNMAARLSAEPANPVAAPDTSSTPG